VSTGGAGLFAAEFGAVPAFLQDIRLVNNIPIKVKQACVFISF